ncbi:hypothetical protein L603_001300000010, partial [Cellulosimicrobium cellulans J34]
MTGGWSPGEADWWGSWFWGSDYDVAREVLQRGTAAVLVVAFVVVVRQWRPLLGERGLRCSDGFVVGLGW